MGSEGLKGSAVPQGTEAAVTPAPHNKRLQVSQHQGHNRAAARLRLNYMLKYSLVHVSFNQKNQTCSRLVQL